MLVVMLNNELERKIRVYVRGCRARGKMPAPPEVGRRYGISRQLARYYINKLRECAQR